MDIENNKNFIKIYYINNKIVHCKSVQYVNRIINVKHIVLILLKAVPTCFILTSKHFIFHETYRLLTGGSTGKVWRDLFYSHKKVITHRVECNSKTVSLLFRTNQRVNLWLLRVRRQSRNCINNLDKTNCLTSRYNITNWKLKPNCLIKRSKFKIVHRIHNNFVRIKRL